MARTQAPINVNNLGQTAVVTSIQCKEVIVKPVSNIVDYQVFAPSATDGPSTMTGGQPFTFTASPRDPNGFIPSGTVVGFLQLPNTGSENFDVIER